MEYIGVPTSCYEHEYSCSYCNSCVRRAVVNTREDPDTAASKSYVSAEPKRHTNRGPDISLTTRDMLVTTSPRSGSHLQPLTQPKSASRNTTRQTQEQSTPHSSTGCTICCNCTRKEKESYQIQRYLKEPAGCGARLYMGAASAPRGVGLVGSGRQDKERRKTAMRRNIKAIERSIGRF